jgi:hypothetical protein
MYANEDFMNLSPGVGFEALAHFVVCQNVECAEFGVEAVQQVHRLSAEPTLGGRRVPLHEEHAPRRVDQFLQPDFEGFCRKSNQGTVKNDFNFE